MNYDEILKDLERRADAIGYDLDNDEGYIEVCNVLENAEGEDLDEDYAEAVEMEIERLEMVLARRKRR